MFMQVVFKPRLPMGIFVSDVQGGRVSGVLDGQAKEQGLEPPGLQSDFQDWISFQFSFQFFSTFSSTSQHGAVVCVSRVDQRHFVMVSIDGQPYSSLPQERNNDDSIVPPTSDTAQQMPIRGEALLEEKKKGNVPYRVPGLVAVLRKSKEAIDKSFIYIYIRIYNIIYYIYTYIYIIYIKY